MVVKDFCAKLHTLKLFDETRYQAGSKNLRLQHLHDGQRVTVTHRTVDSTVLEVSPWPQRQ